MTEKKLILKEMLTAEEFENLMEICRIFEAQDVVVDGVHFGPPPARLLRTGGRDNG